MKSHTLSLNSYFFNLPAVNFGCIEISSSFNLLKIVLYISLKFFQIRKPFHYFKVEKWIFFSFGISGTSTCTVPASGLRRRHRKAAAAMPPQVSPWLAAPRAPPWPVARATAPMAPLPAASCPSVRTTTVMLSSSVPGASTESSAPPCATVPAPPVTK